MPEQKYPNDNLYYRVRSEKKILPVSHIIVPYWKLNFIKNIKGKQTKAAYELSEKLFGYALREFIKDCKITRFVSSQLIDLRFSVINAKDFIINFMVLSLFPFFINKLMKRFNKNILLL